MFHLRVSFITNFEISDVFMNVFLIDQEGLSKNTDVIISPSEKRGGVIIMKSAQYSNKITELFEDKNTNE